MLTCKQWTKTDVNKFIVILYISIKNITVQKKKIIIKVIYNRVYDDVIRLGLKLN